MVTRGQVITAGMGQVIGINIVAVKTMMDLIGVADPKDCMEKVLATFNHFLEEREE